jgi:hypothetical protein
MARTWFAFGLPSKTGCDRTPPRPILFERLGPPRTPIAVCFPSSAWPARSAHSLPPLSLTLPVPPVSARLPARAPSDADLILAVGFRSDGWIHLIPLRVAVLLKKPPGFRKSTRRP